MLDWATISSVSLGEAIELLKPAASFVFGVAVYALLLFAFYKFVARRDFFGAGGRYEGLKEGLPKSKWLTVAEYLLFFPFMVFIWFAFFFVLLIFMSKTQSIDTIMLMAIAVVGAVRITAYFTEELSHDLAKLLPLALLAVFFIDIGQFSISASLSMLRAAVLNSEVWKKLLYYLLFIILMEFVLRILYATVTYSAKKKQKKEAPPEKQEKEEDLQEKGKVKPVRTQDKKFR